MQVGRARRGAALVVALWATLGFPPGRARAEPTKSGGEDAALKWERRGASSGQPLIFLPSLGLPGRYWSRVYEQFESAHPIYVVTFAGSGGVPSIEPPHLEKMIESLHRLIVNEKLKDPVLVGQFLGAHVALRLAAQHPDDVGGILGLPLLAGSISPALRKEESAKATETYLKYDPEMWQPEMSRLMRGVVSKGELADELVAMIRDADQKTYAHVVGELMADPIEECLPRVRCPVYLVTPVAVPSRRGTLEKQQERLNAIVQERMEVMQTQYTNLARCDMFPIRNAEMFVMLDAPDRVTFVLRRYLKRLNDPNSLWDTTIRSDASTQPTDSGDSP